MSQERSDQIKLGSKLKNSRTSLELTLEQVAAQMGWPHQTLLKIEKGEREVKAYELAKLSKIYLRDYAYFLEDEEIADPVVCWRNKQASASTEKEKEFLKFCYYYHDLESITNSQKYKNLPDGIPEGTNLNPETLALEYSRSLCLGARPGLVLRKVLEEDYGIKILNLDLEDAGSALSTRGKFGNAVALNRRNAPWRRTFDLAHELFHLITWHVFAEKGHSDPNVENMAEKFAAALLLPYDELVPEFVKMVKDEQISFLNIIQLAKDFKVSTQAVLYRLANLKYLSFDEVKKTLDDTQNLSLDREMRKTDWDKAPQFSDRYINLAFQSHSLGLISKGKLAEYLNVHQEEVVSFLERHGYSEVTENHAFKVAAIA